eukprot:528161_1
MLPCQLNVNSKVDIINPLTVQWCIGTVKSNKQNEVIEVEMDGIDLDPLVRISDKMEHQRRVVSRSHLWATNTPNDVHSGNTWVYIGPTTINDSIAPLNTHTLNHYYLHNPSAPICTESKDIICYECDAKCCKTCNICTINDAGATKLYCIQCAAAGNHMKAVSDRFCGICKAWLTKNNTYNCRRCHIIYCNTCGITSGKFNSCKKCEIQCKRKKYAKSIRSGIGYDVGIDITNLITSFCLGHIIYCGNVKCYNQIAINNQTELEHGVDGEGHKIYQYKVRRVFAASFYSDSTCFLYGKTRRVLCAECTKGTLKRCFWASLSEYNMETPKTCICSNYDVTDCCKNHAYCGYQKRYWKYARDSEVHIRPSCEYDMNLWINSDGKLRRCKWCWETRALTDPYYYYDEDWMYYNDWDPGPSVCDDADTAKRYGLSKEEHRNKYVCPSRDMMKNKKYNKKGVRRWIGSTKKYRKIKSYNKRRKDKKGSYESNTRFKKRYQLSLQY